MARASSLSPEEEAFLARLHALKFRPRGRKMAVDRLGEVLGKTLPEVSRQPSPRREALGLLGPIWNKAVGPYISSHAQPLRWDYPTLVIRVDSKALVDALTPLTPELLDKLRLHGAGQIQGLRFLQGPLPTPSPGSTEARTTNASQVEVLEGSSPTPAPPAHAIPEWVQQVRPELRTRVITLLEKQMQLQQRQAEVLQGKAESAALAGETTGSSSKPPEKIPLGSGRSEP